MVGSACWSGSTPTVVRKDKKTPGKPGVFYCGVFLVARWIGGCATLTHPTKPQTTPYRFLRTAVGALRLPTLQNHKPHHTVFFGLRWVRCAYPPYKSQTASPCFLRAAVGALRLPILQNYKPHHTVFCGLRWVRYAYPPYKTINHFAPFSSDCGGCAARTYPTNYPPYATHNWPYRRAGKRRAPAIATISNRYA